MPLFLFMFGFETPAQHRSSKAAGRDDEDSRAVFIESSDPDEALRWGRTIGQADARRIRLSETVRKTLIPFFAELGFAPRGGGKWSMGEFLERERDGCHQSILVGRDKFGGRVGVASAQYRSPDHVEWYSWRQAGIRQGALAYKTQTDLEAACALWRELVSEHLVPWWDGCG